MGCPTTPLSCLDPVNIFAGVYNYNCGGFADPSKFKAERAIFNASFNELINNFGVDINYYVNGFDIRKMNALYGEHPTQEYSEPVVIKAYLELEESVSLTQFGMNSDDSLTAYISIKDFERIFLNYYKLENQAFLVTPDGLFLINELDQYLVLPNVLRLINENKQGLKNETGYSLIIPNDLPLIIQPYDLDFHVEHAQRVEPKSDDLIEITALGCDRPGNRGSKIFRITEVLDQDVKSGINPMMGHYVWKIRATRYETSHETNAPQELGNDQVYDNTFNGKLSSTLFPAISTEPKVYTQNVDDFSKNHVYNMDYTNNSVYGSYY